MAPIPGLPSKESRSNHASPKKQVSGLPDYRDIHMETAKGIPSSSSYNDVRMGTAKAFGGTSSEDVRMETARGGTTIRHNKFKPWERQLVESPEVRRKATVAQLCPSHVSDPSSESMLTGSTCIDFLDYYFQTLGYIAARKQRRATFDQDTAARHLTSSEYNKEFKSYCGRERVLLRKRRTKLKVDQFHIIAQVGQGGYGEVYLARKQDSGEVCALKKMRKRTLYKMDEVGYTHHLEMRRPLTDITSADSAHSG